MSRPTLDDWARGRPHLQRELSLLRENLVSERQAKIERGDMLVEMTARAEKDEDEVARLRQQNLELNARLMQHVRRAEKAEAEYARLTRILGWLENSAPAALWRVQEADGTLHLSICAMDDDLHDIGSGPDLCAAVEDAINRERK